MRMAAALDMQANYIKSKIKDAEQRLLDNPNKDEESMSVLEKLISKQGSESSAAIVTAFDMISVGIDTTGKD